jgi:hypothetical protein
MNDKVSESSASIFKGSDFWPDERSDQIEAPQEPPRKLNLGNDKDRAEYWNQLRVKAITELYKGDPLVRAGLEAQAANEAIPSRKTPENVVRDEAGNVTGVAKSVMSGTHATDARLKELMKAIRADVNKRYGISQ